MSDSGGHVRTATTIVYFWGSPPTRHFSAYYDMTKGVFDGILVGMATDTSAKVPLTTIKVPQQLRQRIAGGAAEEGVTAAVFLTGLVDRYDRDRRFAQVRRAYAGYDSGADSDYAELTQTWDRVTAEDLDTDEDIDVA